MITHTPAFCPADTAPSDTVDWARSPVTITNDKGETVYHHRAFNHPVDWSPTAVTVTASKYARLVDGESENGVDEITRRVAGALRYHLTDKGVCDADNALALANDIEWLCLHQHLAFNSPVWFNFGAVDKPQCSACFILSLDDSIADHGESSITGVVSTSARIFQQGGGVGFNVGLRSRKESTSRGGKASGPVSFMRLFDATGGVISSGGATRRAATMITIKADHPDIADFITCKADAEKKAHALIDAGYNGSFNAPGGAYDSVRFQNFNASVRVTDSFMQAATTGGTWDLRAITTGETIDTVNASDLLDEIAQAAWVCGDPGMQFDTTINDWHTCANTDRIYASNPCQPAFATVLTPDGVRTFADIDVGSVIWSGKQWTKVTAKWATGIKPVYRYTTSVGDFIGTENHRIIQNGDRVEVKDAHSIDQCPHPAIDAAVVTAKIEGRVYIGDLEVFDITVEAEEHTYWTGGLLVSNCSEFVFLNDTACNLASLNLLKFLRPDNTFDTDRFVAAVRVAITAMDTIVSASSYPTDTITRNSHNFRPLGLGYANLGALLMSLGLPYDSNEGRALAAAITSLLTAAAYHQSTVLAEHLGPFAGFAANRAPMINVIEKHVDAAHGLANSSDPTSLTGKIAETARTAWIDTEERGSVHGFRNAQVTVLAPTGTIGFMMDCDTTGVEPDFALVKSKKLVGGGTIRIVNQSIPRALSTLGYSPDVAQWIADHIADHGSVETRYLRPEHRAVFACANDIAPSGHLRMMAAVQPFLSGAISKTVNLPNSATPADIRAAYIEAWRIGLKAVAVYRDGCKRTQPLTAQTSPAPTVAPVQPQPQSPIRRRLPDTRASVTHRAEFGNEDFYITVSRYPDGGIGEAFITANKQGSMVRGLLDVIGILFSLAVQHGVPVDAIARKLVGQSFGAAGFTGNPAIPYAASVADYFGRYLQGLQSVTTPEPAPSPAAPPPRSTPTGEGPPCGTCGTTTIRSGTCYKCPNCGTTTGCG